MLSLSPRYDLFRFVLPKDFIPRDIAEKYYNILSKTSGVINTPIDYLNESIKGVHLPGISSLITEQIQHESHQKINGFDKVNEDIKNSNRIGKINVEPQHTISYKSTGNPLEKLERELRVTFRMNQGLLNYFMLYEIVFNQYDKIIDADNLTVAYIEVLDETGCIKARILLKDLQIDGIDGLDFSYDKTTREEGTFDILFKFNNIDFEFLP